MTEAIHCTKVLSSELLVFSIELLDSPTNPDSQDYLALASSRTFFILRSHVIRFACDQGCLRSDPSHSFKLPPQLNCVTVLHLNSSLQAPLRCQALARTKHLHPPPRPSRLLLISIDLFSLVPTVNMASSPAPLPSARGTTLLSTPLEIRSIIYKEALRGIGMFIDTPLKPRPTDCLDSRQMDKDVVCPACFASRGRSDLKRRRSSPTMSSLCSRDG